MIAEIVAIVINFLSELKNIYAIVSSDPKRIEDRRINHSIIIITIVSDWDATVNFTDDNLQFPFIFINS